ncbi:hydrogenase maturation nickel metallochaperone HypA [Butyrivibrio proteoclasticus]|uniref:hydrogenase maturation nickel metallochaperone HypA n=1 Tax=Butyrivibrio proteoclasticus TaxID=43305 RepID=UPI000A4993EC|nr:hydrogenase maturation nickel metallochaperone HypA [Butyrivibrio proteoclasticus]
MHEMSYIMRLAALAIEVAQENNAKRVRSIEVEVGKTSGVMPYYLHKYYPEATKGTLLEGSELVCVEVPVKALCEECNKEYLPSKENRYLCPHCGGRKAHIIAGKSVELKNVTIDD